MEWSADRIRREKARVYPALIADRARQLGIADPSIGEWAAKLILAQEGASLRTEQIARRLREEGEPLSAAERTKAGLPPRIKVGRTFFDALTPLGRTDVTQTAMALCHHPIASWSRAYMRHLAQTDAVQARMLIRDDDRTCTQARAYMRRIVPISELPDFPLPGCDQWVCRCAFDRSDVPESLRITVEIVPEHAKEAPMARRAGGSGMWVLAAVFAAITALLWFFGSR